MSHNLLSALLVATQATAIPSIAPPALGVTQPEASLPVMLPVEPLNCGLEIRATTDSADALPTKIKYFETGQLQIERPLSEEESARATADLLIQLDSGWYAQGRAALYRIGSPDNDPAKASAPFLGMTIDPAAIDLIGTAITMRFWENIDERERFDLSAVDRTKIAAWHDCVKNLATAPVNATAAYHYNPVYYRRQAALQPATPFNKHSWVTSDDYPPKAIREGLQGTVAFTVTVGVNGRVQDCAMTQNTESTITTIVNDVPELNMATCRNIIRRARFAPATDNEGRPLQANYSGRVRWALPYDPTPPPPPPKVGRKWGTP